MWTDSIFISADVESFWRWLKQWIGTKNEKTVPKSPSFDRTYHELLDPDYQTIVRGQPPYIFEVWRIRTVLTGTIQPSMSFYMDSYIGPPLPAPGRKRDPVGTQKLALKITLTEEDDGSRLEIEGEEAQGVAWADFILDLDSASWSVVATPPMAPGRTDPAMEQTQAIQVPLSTRYHDVADLIADGHSNSEIVNITRHKLSTVQDYAKEIASELGLSTSERKGLIKALKEGGWGKNK
jgi:hypothetical protein